ncbi:putative GRIP and coiled-coil domain-containing protein 2 [Apostichopus japonicus]|uniref:Putative GRIP and coiled-coil domain-containing protein 2 n=1 Tax=Stichopus japonicus TaxID=307972 RepID=A0A2G8JTE1_STIJA|nr:putative GRIP and coiled-coil domain-containing protein 2 [Apostichopus japonicus]
MERNLAEVRCKVMALENELEKEATVREEKEEELREALEKNNDFEDKLKRQAEDNDKTTKRLEAALQGASQSNLMDLEIAEYERTVSSLNADIAEKDKSIAEIRQEVERLEKRMESMEKEKQAQEGLLEQAEERGNKLKQLLVKTKKDLADSKKAEMEQKSTEAALKGQMEHLIQQSEQFKLEMSGVLSENQKLQDQIRSSSDANVRTIRSLEMKNESLMDDLEMSRSQLVEIQGEFDSYKVRAQSVLKQQKTRDTSLVPPDMTKGRERRLEEVISQLRSKLQESNDKLTAMKHESEHLQEEHDRLLQRHGDIVQDLQLKEKTWRDKLEKMRVEKSERKQTETIKELSYQNEIIASTFKDQIKQLRSDHQRTTEQLQHQLDGTENQLFRLQEQQQASSFKDSHKDEANSRPKAVEEREQGEGMENPEQEVYPKLSSHRSTSVTSDHEAPTFAQLLSTTSEDKQSIISGISSSAEEEHVRVQLTTARKKLEHFTEITSENEATILRLTEQSKILKEEIRRLERNQARENAISNLEYLKNVVLKFMVLPKGDEKGRLVPVLETMLKLSEEESKKLVNIAQDEEMTSSIWTGYLLHRWSGGLM